MKDVTGKSEISHFCQIVTNFPGVGDKLNMLYCTAETAHIEHKPFRLHGAPKLCMNSNISIFAIFENFSVFKLSPILFALPAWES